MVHLDLAQSRYHRQELITWWDQSRLRAGKVLVVGAGAIGNEVVKNLSLVGVGHISIVDMDTIEHSNLARCVFFREKHEGKFKSEVLATEAMLMNPEIKANYFTTPIQRLGIGALDDFDIIIGALDNREARAWVNQAARKLGKFWIDGAIEGLRGLVRIFGPQGPCYSCTLTEADYKQMSHRRSCALLAPEEIISGKTPTNATTAGIVAGVQVQEAIKYLVGREDMMSLVGKCWVYTGDTMATYVTGYQPDDFCMDHDRYEQIVDEPTPKALTYLVGRAIEITGEKAVAVDFEEDLIQLMPCESCGGDEISRVRSSLNLGEGLCSNCGKHRTGSMSASLEIDDHRLKLGINEFKLPEREIITIRTQTQRVHFRLKDNYNG
jgi:adenylyltransferase/sulfurtransferase